MIEGFRRRPRRTVAAGTAVLATCVALAALAAAVAQADPPPALFAGGMNGIVFAHGSNGRPHGGRNPQLVYHFGPVMTTGAAATSIFWGTSWGSNPGDEVSGMDAFYNGVGGSNYLGTTTEYTDTSSQHVSSAVSYTGHAFDTAAAPSSAPSTSQVLQVVSDTIQSPVSNGYYPVYSDQPRGHAGYCAWHSSGTVHGVFVRFAFFFKLDGDFGCDPGPPYDGHSEGLAALGNVSGHELSETVTDPNGNAWYDSSGAENADKCAWTFGSSSLKLGSSLWRIQGNWSNAAYTNGGSYLGSGSGCVDGN